VTKPKKCKAKGCGVVFTPARPMQCACSPLCALTIARSKREQAEAKKAREARAMDRQSRERIKPRGVWLREAQAAFNAWIRKRDEDHPCISCGRHHRGQWHAGHYMSVGARPEYRFNPNNCHRQCMPCNTHLHGNLVLYRAALIVKIGIAEVEKLEGPSAAMHYIIADLKAIRDKYRVMVREIERSS